jgi:excisionase family DNA binding protein
MNLGGHMETRVEQIAIDSTKNDAVIDRIQFGDWITAAEAAAYAGGVGISTVREACNRNELRHVRVGGRPKGPIRTRAEWVDQWLERWTRGGEVM